MVCATGDGYIYLRYVRCHVWTLFKIFLFLDCATFGKWPILFCSALQDSYLTLEETAGKSQVEKGGFSCFRLLQLSEMKMLVLWEAHQW